MTTETTQQSGERVALVTGIAGGLARLTGAALVERGYRVVGVDYRDLPEALPYEATVYRASYNKTRIEDIFRRHRPSHVLHLGRVGNLAVEMQQRYDLNVVGGRRILEQALKYGARRLVVLSTFHIYGAHPHNHTPIYEDEPLRAGTEFPKLGDAIQLDAQAQLWVYQNPEVQTVVLRPCNVVGPHINNAISRFLRQPLQPTMLGFDPMVQFIHEDDMVSAIIAAAEGEAVGVFNVAGRSPVPWREALKLSGGRQLPFLSSFASGVLGALNAVLPVLPAYMINFSRYPCVIADDAFRRTFNWQPRVDEVETIRSAVQQQA